MPPGYITINIAGVTERMIKQGYIQPTPVPIPVTSITSVGALATVTTTVPHKLGVGVSGSITGTLQPQYNLDNIRPTVTSPTTFTYLIVNTAATASSPATPATGTPVAAKDIPPVGASFTYAVVGPLASPATGTITAAGGRLTVPGIAYIDGYFCVMDVYGVIYSSAIDDPSEWGALDYTTAQAITGNGVYIGRSANYVAAFKQWSTEFFYNAGNPVGSPLSPVENGFTQVGCAAAQSVAQLGNSYFFISQVLDVRGRSVHQMQGTQQTRISTPDVERVLNRSNLVTIYSYATNLDGHSLYFLTLVDLNVTLVYDIGTQVWTTWTSGAPGSESYFKMARSVSCGGKDLMLHESNGTVYEITPDAHDDAGEDIAMFTRSDKFDRGTIDYKPMAMMVLVANRQVGTFEARWSDDDCQTFSPWRPMDMSTANPQLRRSRDYRRRTIETRQIGNIPCIAQSLELTP
jgi:hypothetical protein